MTEGGGIENHESATSLYGSFSPWLVFPCFSVSVIFCPFSPVDQKNRKYQQCRVSGIYEQQQIIIIGDKNQTPNPKFRDSARSVGVLRQNDVIQWKTSLLRAAFIVVILTEDGVAEHNLSLEIIMSSCRLSLISPRTFSLTTQRLPGLQPNSVQCP